MPGRAPPGRGPHGAPLARQAPPGTVRKRRGMKSALTNYLHLPVGANAPEEINVVVEIPQGSRNKYEYDKNLNIFRLDRALHSPVYYPGDYGFMPQTLAEDGDPLDVLILVEQPTFPGCLVVARPIGMLKMIDDGLPDDKILAVPVGEPPVKGDDPRLRQDECGKSGLNRRLLPSVRFSERVHE